MPKARISDEDWDKRCLAAIRQNGETAFHWARRMKAESDAELRKYAEDYVQYAQGLSLVDTVIELADVRERANAPKG